MVDLWKMSKPSKRKLKKHYTKRYVRYRIRNPNLFIRSSLRTHDIGRKGHSKRIAGRLKSTRKWATQAVLITRTDHKRGVRVKGYDRTFRIVK